MATLPNSYDFVVDIEGHALVRSFTSRKTAAPPQFIFGDPAIPITVRLVRPSTASDPDLPWTQVDLTAINAVDISVGDPAAEPSAGTWEITHDSQTTINLAYNASAGNVQTELNKLSSIQSDGNVTVVSPRAGLYRITWNSKGARNIVTTETTALYPTVTSDVREAVTGSGSQREVQLIDIEVAKAVNLELTTALDAAAATITEVRHGTLGSTSEIQKIDLSTPEPYAGTWTATVDTGEVGTTTHQTGTLAYNISASALQTALIATNTTVFTSNITVTGEFPVWTIEYDSQLGNVAIISVDINQLDVPTGFQGNLSTNTTTFKELLAGKAAGTAAFEVKIHNSTSSLHWTALQVPCSIKDDVHANPIFS